MILSDRLAEYTAACFTGLTRFEAEGAFSLSLVRHRRIEPESVFELKSGMLKKSGLLTLHRGHESFADLGGLDNLKSFCMRAMRGQGNRDPLRRPKGVFLMSPPGCGKSQFAKARWRCQENSRVAGGPFRIPRRRRASGRRRRGEFPQARNAVGVSLPTRAR